MTTVIQYYAYIWCDPLTNTPVYVGKGSGDRVQDHFNSKYRIGNLLRKRREEGFHLVPKIILAADEADAFEIEIFLISFIGRLDTGEGPLFNGTDGGDGVSGQIQTFEKRAKISALKKGCKQSAEHIAKRVAANTGRKLGPQTAEQRESKSARLKGKKLKPQSAEHIAKRVAANTGRKLGPQTAEHLAKRMAAKAASRIAKSLPNDQGVGINTTTLP